MTPTIQRHANLRGKHLPLDVRGLRQSTPRPTRIATATVALLSLLVLAAGCGGSKPPGAQSGGRNTASDVLARFEAYSKCMRSHDIPDFPDPTASPGGGVGIQIDGGPGSDLNRNNPKFRAANQACRSLEPGAGSQPPAQSPEKIAAEVKWARCMRTHGLPSFPDPDSQGAFDSSKFNENAPAFQSASNACTALMNAVGAIPVHPGHQ